MTPHDRLKRTAELETRIPIYVAEIIRLKSEQAQANARAAAIAARLKEVESLYNKAAKELETL